MSKVVRLNSKQVNFPPVCVVCEAPAVTHTYTVSSSVYYGRQTITANLPVPMCAEHYTLATSKNKKEQRVGKIGLIAAILVGLIIAFGLIVYWASTGQGNPAANIFLAIFVGASLFVVVWLATLLWLAPAFADPQVKKVRRAAHIKAFAPNKDLIELEVENDNVADLIAEENPVE